MKVGGFNMTIPFAGFLARACAFLIAAAMAGQGSAADNVWQGTYYSNARSQEVAVRLTLPSDAKPGELRFVTLACAVGLQPEPAGPTGAAVYLIQPREDAAGPYCGGWLGGRLETRSLDGGRRLQITVTRGKSKIEINNLVPASGLR